MAKVVEIPKQDGSGLRIGIVRARWNSDLIEELVAQCRNALLDCHVPVSAITSIDVPGSFELVHGAHRMIESGTYDAVVCIGVLVKGETLHFEYISQAVSSGIAQLNASRDVPVIFGVLTCLSEDQVRARVRHAYEWGLSAVEMGRLKHTMHNS